MNHGDEYNPYASYGSGSHSGPKTAEDYRQQFERMKAENARSLQNLGFEENEKGETSFLGLPISREMKPVIEVAYDGVRPFIIDQSQRIGKGAEALARGMKCGAHSAKIGLVAENVFRWGLVGTKQIFDTVRAGNHYSQERKELYTTLAPVMQNTGANLKNNEVIKVAFDDVHANWVSEMRKVMADIPSLVPMTIFAIQDQIKSRKKTPETHATPTATARDAELARWRADRKVIDEQYAALEAKAATAHGVGTDAYHDEVNYLRERKAEEIELIGKRFDKTKHDENHSEHAPLTKSETTEKLLWGGLIPLGALFGQKLKSDINAEIDGRKKKVRGWRMIEHLKTEIEGQCGNKRGYDSQYEDCQRETQARTAEEIHITGLGSRDGETLNLKQYIVELFQQHERDREPNRNFYNKKTGKAVEPLKGNMLNNLMPLVDVIAESVADGTIAPDALYKLVGENMVIKHDARGSRSFVKKDELQKIIEKDLAPVLGTREVMKMEEFMAKFADPAMIEGALKQNLKQMQGLERALFASLFPDDILQQAGMSKRDILDSRKRAHEHAYDFVASVAIHASNKDMEALKKLGVTEHEAEIIHNMAESVKAGDVKAIKRAVDGHDKEVVDAVRTVGLLEQVKGGQQGKGYWTERVKEMAATRATVTKAAKEAEEERKRNGGDEAHEGARHGSDRRRKDDYGYDGGEYKDSGSRYADRFERSDEGYSSREKSRDTVRHDRGLD